MIDSVMLFKLITEDSFAKHFLGISHNDWTWSAFLIATRQRFRTEQFSFHFKQHSNGKTSSRVFKEHLNKKWALLGAKRNIPAVLAWNFLYTSRTELSKYWQLDYDIGLIIYLNCACKQESKDHLKHGQFVDDILILWYQIITDLRRENR